MSPQSTLKLFNASGNWYRGNLHTHTTNSDGRKKPADAINWYRTHGYDFIALTDHDRVTNFSKMGDEHFLILPGGEIHIKNVLPDKIIEMLVIGFYQPLDFASQGYFPLEAISQMRAGGGIFFLCHPQWAGLSPEEVEVILQQQNPIGLEVFNSDCDQDVRGYSRAHWDYLLSRKKLLWGLATDDTHWQADEGRGWIMVKAPSLTFPAILEALTTGNFYASQGPEIYDYQITDKEIYVRCSPAMRIEAFSREGYSGRIAPWWGKFLSEAIFPLQLFSHYVRIECIDMWGRVAWTPPILL